MRHELGHFLGLNEGAASPPPPSIMNKPVVNPGDRCKDLFLPTLFVQDNDATKVGECVAQARRQHTVAPSYAYNEYNFTYGCYSYYEVTDYYLCFGNSCSYWFSTYSFLGSNCMLTQ